MSLLEIVVTLLLLLGTGIMILGSIGLLRFGDVFLRMHAATKSGTLGIGFIMAAVALYFSDALVTIKLLALLGIYFFTSPIGSQVLAHAAHVARVPLVKETWIDELTDHETASNGYHEEGNPH
jgi:multicomponent Na+:H+ antiporter subunit G